MPDYRVERHTDGPPFEACEVQLNKVPKRGSWFDIGDGTPAQVKEVRIIGGEPVIFARLGGNEDRHRLKADRR